MTEYPKLRLVAPDMLLEHADFEEDEAEIIRSSTTAGELVDRLRAIGRDKALATATAFMLPTREAIWTACLWAKVGEDRFDAVRSRALRAAEIWVRDQSEEARYKAFELANEEGLDRPGAWAGMAAFWCGRSISPPDVEPVFPESHHAPIAVAMALILTLAEIPLEESAARLMADLALEVAAGRNGLQFLAETLSSNRTLD